MGLVRFLSFYSIIFIAYSCSNNTASADASAGGLKWKVTYVSANGRVQDSISYIGDSNKCHGVRISLHQIKFTKGSSSRIESMNTIQEYYNGKEDGKYLAFDSENNLIAVEDLESKVIIGSYIAKGYKFKFYPNGNVESLDTIIDFYK